MQEEGRGVTESRPSRNFAHLVQNKKYHSGRASRYQGKAIWESGSATRPETVAPNTQRPHGLTIASPRPILGLACGVYHSTGEITPGAFQEAGDGDVDLWQPCANVVAHTEVQHGRHVWNGRLWAYVPGNSDKSHKRNPLPAMWFVHSSSLLRNSGLGRRKCLS